MAYIISTAESEFNTYWKPSEYRRHYLRWKPEQVFEWVARDADPAGTWQNWWKVDDQDKARAELERMGKGESGSWCFADTSISNGYVIITTTAIKLEWLNDDTGDIELLDWYAEGFEHEPEDEGSAE